VPWGEAGEGPAACKDSGRLAHSGAAVPLVARLALRWYGARVALEQDEDLNTPEMKRLLRTLGARPSKSAEQARERELAAIDTMSVEERMLLALRLGRRDRAMLAGRARAAGR
jgi:hypothetical protein